MDDSQCSVYLDELYDVPFELVQGDSVYAKVIATNLIGDSEESSPGNGAIVVTVPDAAVDLLNMP